MVTTQRLRLGLPHPDSPGEQALHRIQRDEDRLPDYRFNLRIAGHIVDLSHWHAKVAIEIDGYRWHDANPEQAARDKARDRDLQDEGWMIRRYTSSEVVRDPRAIADELEDVTRKRLADLDERRRLEHAQREQAKANDPRVQLYRYVRRIGLYFDKTEGPGAGADVVKRINRTLARDFGPASKRSADQQQQALDWIDTRWTKIRAEHDIPLSALPDWNDIVEQDEDVETAAELLAVELGAEAVQPLEPEPCIECGQPGCRMMGDTPDDPRGPWCRLHWPHRLVDVSKPWATPRCKYGCPGVAAFYLAPNGNRLGPYCAEHRPPRAAFPVSAKIK